MEKHFQLCNKAFSGCTLMSRISYPSEEKHCNSQAEEASLSYVLNTDLKDKMTHQVSASSIS